jgi:hypothetical protein
MYVIKTVKSVKNVQNNNIILIIRGSVGQRSSQCQVFFYLDRTFLNSDGIIFEFRALQKIFFYLS